MIGISLSGGGSRAIAFHLGCLRALDDLGVLENIQVMSAVSGGSVIGAYYAYTPNKSFEDFEADVRGLLRNGLQRSIAIELMKPHNLLPCLITFFLTQIHEVLSFLGKEFSGFRRYPSRTDILQKVLEKNFYPDLKLNSPRRNSMEIVIGACEARTGSAFRFGNDICGSWRLGKLQTEVNVSLAVAASAAYPMFLPTLDRTWSFEKDGHKNNHRILLTDGGVYDNLGTQVLEPGRDPTVSLHTYPCDYLIVCNAGHGQESGREIPLGFARRVRKTFSTIHRRVQDSSMNRLHQLEESGAIRGFAMPYLGQQDSRLPWKPAGFISREEVVDYPTDFGAMEENWIEKLSSRGEQLTKILLTHYLPELL